MRKETSVYLDDAYYLQPRESGGEDESKANLGEEERLEKEPSDTDAVESKELR